MCPCILRLGSALAKCDEGETVLARSGLAALLCITIHWGYQNSKQQAIQKCHHITAGSSFDLNLIKIRKGARR